MSLNANPTKWSNTLKQTLELKGLTLPLLIQPKTEEFAKPSPK